MNRFIRNALAGMLAIAMFVALTWASTPIAPQQNQQMAVVTEAVTLATNPVAKMVIQKSNIEEQVVLKATPVTYKVAATQESTAALVPTSTGVATNELSFVETKADSIAGGKAMAMAPATPISGPYAMATPTTGIGTNTGKLGDVNTANDALTTTPTAMFSCGASSNDGAGNTSGVFTLISTA